MKYFLWKETFLYIEVPELRFKIREEKESKSLVTKLRKNDWK